MDAPSSSEDQTRVEPAPGSNDVPWDILTTLRWDLSSTSQYLLPFHRDRMLSAARAFGRPFPENLEGDAGLKEFESLLSREALAHAQTDLGAPYLRLRVALSQTGKISVTVTTLPKSPCTCLLYPRLSTLLGEDRPAAYRIFLSPIATKPSLHTVHKTTFRGHYDDLRSLLPKWATDAQTNDGLLPEILMCNEDGETMEGTFTTPYLEDQRRDGNDGIQCSCLITPRAQAGGNLGTTRRWALEKDWCEEARIMKDDISIGQSVWLSNGVRGWGWGRVEPWEKGIQKAL